MNIFKRIFRKPIKVGDLVEFELGYSAWKKKGVVMRIETHEEPYFSPRALIEILEGFKEPFYHRIWKRQNPQLARFNLHPKRYTWIPLDKCKKFKRNKGNLKFGICRLTMAMLMVSVFLYFYIPDSNNMPFFLRLFISICVGWVIGDIADFIASRFK